MEATKTASRLSIQDRLPVSMARSPRRTSAKNLGSGYYWGPTAILGKYPMVKLDNGVPFDEAEWKRCTVVADCPDPKPNGWAKSDIYTVVTKKFSDAAGPAFDYLKKRQLSTEEFNKLLAWMVDNQATGEDGAKYYLKNNEAVWTKWVSPEAAEKIKAAVQ